MKQIALLFIGLLCAGLVMSGSGCAIGNSNDGDDGQNRIGAIGGGENEDDESGGDPFCVPFCQAAITCFGEETLGTTPECVEECNATSLAARECVALLCNRPTTNDTDSLDCVLFAACVLSCDALDLDSDSSTDTDDTDTLLELIDTDTDNWIPCFDYIPTGFLLIDYCCQETFPEICFGLAFNGFCNCGGYCFWDSSDCLKSAKEP